MVIRVARARWRFPVGRSVRRKTTWVGPADQQFVSVATGASVIIASFDPQGAAMLAPTIVRTRGQISFRWNTTGADSTLSGAFGVGIVSDEAFAAGTASIPRPFDDADWGGWLLWGAFAMQLDFNTGVGAQMLYETREADSKAMRKVTANETVVLMCESQSGAVDIAMHLRLLFKLS